MDGKREERVRTTNAVDTFENRIDYPLATVGAGAPVLARRICLVVLVVFFFSAIPGRASSNALQEVYLPFHDSLDFTKYSSMKNRLLDGYGAYRRAGHMHAGLDIKGKYDEKVYSIGDGTVAAIYDEFPYRTVLIEHVLVGGEKIYSGYIHLEDIEVGVGQTVDHKTAIGRLFSKSEHKKSKFYKNHLHFEIRKTMERYRGISIKCKTMEELNRYFYDPSVFLREHMKK